MNTQTIEQLVFECGLQTPWVVVSALVMLLLFAWLLFRERHHLGAVWATAFWGLRALALAVLVWMFLQPARVTETKSTLPQSVAVIVDQSPSMTVVDPAGEGQGIRWQLVGLEDDEADLREAQTAVDSALVAIEVAQAMWTTAQDDLQAGSGSDAIEQTYQDVAFALKRASVQLDEKFGEHSNVASDETRAKEFSLDLMELADFATDFKLESTGKEANQQIDRSQQRLNELTDLNRLIKTWSRSIEQGIAQTVADRDSSANRQTQVMQLLRKTDQQAPTDSETPLSIKRFTFDEQLTPVLSKSGWGIENPDDPTASVGRDEEFEIDQAESADVPAATNLTAAIEQIMQLAGAQSIQSVIFLTDGAHNAAGALNPAEIVAKWKNLAISFVPIGSLKRVKDVQLYHVEHPRSVIRGDQILIEALVSADGFNGETVNLQLWADEELIEEKGLVIDADQIDLKHSFTVPTKQLGSIEFELKVEPHEDETSTANNRVIFRVGVVQDKIRVMLADRISRWEYRYLDQLLYRDKHLEHEMILFDPRLRATGKLKMNAAMPATLEEWGEYDVAMIGDVTPEQFPRESQESLVEFVKEKGGIVILIAGRSGMPHSFEDEPLFDLLPVEKFQEGQEFDQYHVKVNQLAAGVESIHLDKSRPKSELLWNQVFEDQPITWLSEYSSPKPSARRLLDAIPVDDEGKRLDPNELESRPSWVCWQQLGAGRVVYLSAPDTYRLRYRRGDRLHHLFWAQLMRWITSEDPGSDDGRVQLTTDKVKYQRHEPIQVIATLLGDDGEPFSDAQLEAVFDSGDNNESVFALTADETRPGRYVANVEGLPAGAYRIALRGEEIEDVLENGLGVKTFINVANSADRETVNTACNRPLMKQIAQVSGGQVIPPTAFAEWLELQTGVPETISQVERQPLWNRWSCLWIAFGCLATEWFVRRMKGLT